MARVRFVAAFLVLAVLILVVTMLAFGVLGGGSPSLAAPAPLPLFIAIAFVGEGAFFLPTALFIAWSWPLSRGQDRFPTRSLVLMALLIVLSIVWHVRGGWRHYYGAGIAYIWLGLVGLMIAVAGACRLRPRFWLNAAAHWLLFAWLASYAFAWYGEVP
jgi:hypothetical protein